VLQKLYAKISTRKTFTWNVLIRKLFLLSNLLVCYIPHCLIAIVTISTILVDRDDVAVGSRHDNQTGGKHGGVLPLLVLVWDDGLLGNVRNRRVSILDPRILADDDRTCLWSAPRKIGDRLADGFKRSRHRIKEMFFFAIVLT